MSEVRPDRDARIAQIRERLTALKNYWSKPYPQEIEDLEWLFIELDTEATRVRELEQALVIWEQTGQTLAKFLRDVPMTAETLPSVLWEHLPKLIRKDRSQRDVLREQLRDAQARDKKQGEELAAQQDAFGRCVVFLAACGVAGGTLEAGVREVAENYQRLQQAILVRDAQLAALQTEVRTLKDENERLKGRP
jgi:DNA repair exonuclease SbcCD ATPase subunit